MTIPEKPADTQFPIHELIRRRWSPRAFADRPVTAAQLGSLLEAARWAASSNNEQPWRFLVVTKAQPEAFAALLACLASGNQVWARQAPVLMLTVAKLTFENGTPNRHAFHDVGQAAASMAIQATAMGLVIHQMAGFSVEAARTAFAIPADYEPVAAIAIGYQAEAATLPEPFRARETAPRARDPLAQVAFGATWGTAGPFTA